MTDLNLSFEERQQLADEMGIEPADVDQETIRGYSAELAEQGRGAEAARLVRYLGSGASAELDAIQDEHEGALWRSLAAHLGLPGSEEKADRSYEQEEEDELFAEFAPYLGIPTDQESGSL